MKILKLKTDKFEEVSFAQVGRAKFLRYFLLLIFIIFISRIFELQVLSSSKYKAYSEAQAIKKIRTIPPRGQIYDRNGKLLVHNQASYNLTIIPASFDSSSYEILTNLVQIDTIEALKAFQLKKKFERYSPITVLKDMDFPTLSLVQEYIQYLSGVAIDVEGKRLYQDSVKMPHILGYIREINDRQLQQMPYYKSGDLIGQAGLEKNYEEFLRGIEGYEIVAYNRKGEKVLKFNEGTQDQAPVGGANLYLSIDFDLQYYAEKLLEGKRGAIVGLNPNNGEVLFMVSKPDFSPDIFNGKLTQEDADFLFRNESKPMINRAIQGTYPPGSTWKMLMAIAGLQDGIITPSSTFFCGGGFHFGDRTIKCHGNHGNANVLTAIQGSCNPFFSQLALKEGMDVFSKWGHLFNFGQKTGIDLPNEKPGILPDKDWLQKTYGNTISYPGRLINFGIGQGEINVTPLQMALYTATIANGGTIYQPHLVREIEDLSIRRKSQVEYYSKKLPIDDWVINLIHKAMYYVVNVGGGTATGAAIPGIKVCGKTGTAQNSKSGDHSWFVCFAPMDKPQIAIAVIVENAGFGAQVAAPIAKDLLMKYFHVQPKSSNNDSTIVQKPEPNGYLPD